MISLRPYFVPLLLVVLFAYMPFAHAAGTGVLGGSTDNTQTNQTGVVGGGTDNTQSAQQNSGQNVTLINPLSAGTDLPTLIKDILQLVVQLGSIVVILMLVYIGFMFVTAQGDPGKITKAREALLWTIVGALVLLGAEAIAQGIQATVSALSSGN